jgi:hypothetical protein
MENTVDKNNNYYRHAMLEFKAAGWIDEKDNFNDDMQEMICNHVLKLLDVFHGEGHSGSSAPYAIDLFSKLAKFMPVAPLTGEDWEWNEVGDDSTDGKMFQNKRCGAVFKCDKRFNGQPYYLDAVVFWEWYKNEDGEMRKTYFTSSGSPQPIVFPYTPLTEYKFSPTEEYPNEQLVV